MGKLSRDKGAQYERDIASVLKNKFGIDVKRTGAQERWKSHGGDVNAPVWTGSILTEIFWECKNRQSWNVLDWYKKAVDDAEGSGRKVAVVMSKNREANYIFMGFDDFLKILYELEGYRKDHPEG